MELIKANVLWIDHRDGHGIAVDDLGNEYYISSDCYPADLKRGDNITGQVKYYNKGCSGLIAVEKIKE